MTKFKLTFNKPAVERFLGEEFTGMKVRIEGGEVEFLPVADSRDDDVIPISERGSGGRGGAEMPVEGAEASTLLELFNRMNPQGRFFTLKKSPMGDGWISVVSHSKTTPPPKFTPHMRVWSNPVATIHKVASTSTCEAFEKPVDEMTLADLRELSQRIAAYEAERRPGRPPRDILDIKSKIEEFRLAVTPLLPVTNPDLVLLESVHAMLGKVLHKEDAIVHAKEANPVVEAPKPAPAKVREVVAKAPAPREEPRSFRSRDEAAITDEAIARMAKSLGVGERSEETSDERRRLTPPSTVSQRLAHGRHRSVAVERLGQRRRNREHANA